MTDSLTAAMNLDSDLDFAFDADPDQPNLCLCLADEILADLDDAAARLRPDLSREEVATVSIIYALQAFKEEMGVIALGLAEDLTDI